MKVNRQISLAKSCFEKQLELQLQLHKIEAPLFVAHGTGVNDDLNGIEKSVNFDIPSIGVHAEVVHSLAKWKRMALGKYGYKTGEGFFTDMRAIRRNETLDATHSFYVDQWDWEKVIEKEDRHLVYLQKTVRSIVKGIVETLNELRKSYPEVITEIQPEVTFVTSQFLEDQYPKMTPKERENAYVEEHGTVFIMQIGGKMASGEIHDLRAPDYDDWQLNGDLFIWHEGLGQALEISSMGIRVDSESLKKQLEELHLSDRLKYDYHRMIVEQKLPFTIGGGIGQSRLCMLLLNKKHIGEVQVSIWDEKTSEGNQKLL